MPARDEEATLADPTEGHSAIEYPDDVAEQIDPRFHSLEKTASKEADESLSGVGEKEEVIYVEFEKGDTRNPVNFSRRNKWMIATPAILFTLISAANGSTYALGFDSMTRDLNCTRFQAIIGLSMFTLGFGVVPLVTASFSEEFGRQPLYICSVIGFALMHLMAALAKNIQTVLIARFLSGAFGSTGSTMVGGTISDLWPSYERGLPMAVFAVAAIGGTGLGPVAAGWIEMNPRLEWRWIQWISLILTGAIGLTMVVFMTETRSAVLLTRIAKKTRKETGDKRYRARVEDERADLKTLIYISCTRPVYLLLTEPVLASCSLWLGFAWGILYVLIESITPIFQSLHNFNATPARTLFVWACFAIYLSVFTYLADCYGPFASSALAGQSLCRNLAGMAFPLFTQQMYAAMTYKWANTLFACLAALMIPIPFVLFKWGPTLREKSKFASKVMQKA
ncbi:hypothetical protein EIP91_006724 [Steccherinum ochraceum]|uniref:Major facilitator superfamily (MFS) profile domain-containing protein n=1 Tax=Steccherinum ochraceum TaxID=92696 RepID=A0A4R0RJV1_9APHY|nr:hypothetical protein EIP91_006724 [Steccherinum ochraceum]